MSLLKIVLSLFKKTYMLLMEYPSVEGEVMPYYDKKANWDLFHAYIDAHIQRLIYEYPGG